MQFHVGRFEIPPNHVRLVSATVLVNLLFTSKLCFSFFFTLVASAQVKESCWAEGRVAVDYPYSNISLVQKEKDVNEPLTSPAV